MASDVVVITGASSGIGRAAALRFARQGARLVLAARSADSLEEVAAQCRRLGAEAVPVVTDVSVERDVVHLVDAAVAHFARIDVWVGAASGYAFGTFERTPPELFRHLLEVNLFGQVYGVRAVLPQLRRQRSGTIVLVGSAYSRITAPYVSAYAMSKAATLSFARVLDHELRGSGITVSSVLPATADTPIHQKAANATGERVSPLPPVISPHRVARAIVRVARRPRPITKVGRAQWLAFGLERRCPWLFSRLITGSWRVFGLRGGTVPPHEGTVFEPDESANAITGGWRSLRVRGAVVVGAAALLLGAASALRRRA